MLTLSNDIQCCLAVQRTYVLTVIRVTAHLVSEAVRRDLFRGKVVVALYYDGVGVFGKHFVFIRYSDHNFYGCSLDGYRSPIIPFHPAIAG